MSATEAQLPMFRVEGKPQSVKVIGVDVTATNGYLFVDFPNRATLEEFRRKMPPNGPVGTIVNNLTLRLSLG